MPVTIMYISNIKIIKLSVKITGNKIHVIINVSVDVVLRTRSEIATKANPPEPENVERRVRGRCGASGGRGARPGGRVKGGSEGAGRRPVFTERAPLPAPLPSPTPATGRAAA